MLNGSVGSAQGNPTTPNSVETECSAVPCTMRYQSWLGLFPDIAGVIVHDRLSPQGIFPFALRAGAQRINEGYYPLDIMGELGRAGALGVHLDRNGARYGLSIAAMEAASRACGFRLDSCFGATTCAGSTWSSPAMRR
jgi:hypothetical protein